MAYYVYILKSLKDGKFYIGCTTDVEARLRFHNGGLQRKEVAIIGLGILSRP
ncbi:MAG TPA: GIY-YIG nuclease family protein [Flavisolibacter sp.]|nr:GIY-YIG nuclease family protein [Flavisolibacter sp.]